MLNPTLDPKLELWIWLCLIAWSGLNVFSLRTNTPFHSSLWYMVLKLYLFSNDILPSLIVSTVANHTKKTNKLLGAYNFTKKVAYILTIRACVVHFNLLEILSEAINALVLELIDTIYNQFGLSLFRLQLHCSFLLTSSRNTSLQIVVAVQIQRAVRIQYMVCTSWGSEFPLP